MQPAAARPDSAPAAASAVREAVAPASGIAGTLFDRVLEQGVGVAEREAFVAEFLAARTVREALTALFGAVPVDGAFALSQVINRVIARIDGVLNLQVNAILHHPELQQLEASWRGLRHLVETYDPQYDGDVRIRVWNCSKRDLQRDLERSLEFDQSQLFEKVYEEEFGTAGGQPYGALIADYEFSNHPGDIDLMTRLSQVAAAAFAPCVTGAGPGLFEMDSFIGLERITSFDETFNRPSYVKWRSLRESEDSRFLALALPRILMRRPYDDAGGRRDGFRFVEDVSGSDRRGYLWGNAAYAFGEVAIRAFQQSGWLAAVRGVQPGDVSGGLSTGVEPYWFETDTAGVAPRCATEVIVTEHQEKSLAEAGFLPLCDLQGTGYAAFFSAQSVQKARTYDTLEATQNAKMSTMLQYMLCVAQFARYIKMMGRDFLGAFTEVEDLQRRLSNWLVKYTTKDDDASPAVKARYPLRAGRVQIKPAPEKPGAYNCSLFLQPQYELDDMSASIHLATELAGQKK